MDYTLAEDVFPLTLGKRWVYTTGAFIFTREITMYVAEKEGSRYLIKVKSRDINVSAVIKLDVDMSLVAISRTAADSMDDEEEFETIPKTEIIKSPIQKGASWENSLGFFEVMSTDFSFKANGKTYQECIYIKLNDTSGGLNDIYIKPGIGIVFAVIDIDGIGKVYLDLKSWK